jgi:hypothetical protein
MIVESETLVKPEAHAGSRRISPTLSGKKKGLKNQPLKTGAGDGDRTHDLMLGKHTL